MNIQVLKLQSLDVVIARDSIEIDRVVEVAAIRLNATS